MDTGSRRHPRNERDAGKRTPRGTSIPLVTAPAHTVLAEADGTAYASLRKRPVDRAERYALGKRAAQAGAAQVAGRLDAARSVGPIRCSRSWSSHEGRVGRLVPVRVGRMVASPYGFLRGTAVVMAEDVAHLPATGITPVVCGDSHLGNFGFYASPERDLVIDLNDFDEAHPGCWEWDLRRLVASIWVAGRANSTSEDQCADAVQTCVAAYREEVRFLADQPLMSRSFGRMDVDQLAARAPKPLRARDRPGRPSGPATARATARCPASPRRWRAGAGSSRSRRSSPACPTARPSCIGEALDEYLLTLSPHWRRVLGGYTIVDVAHKVVGVGSVGLRAYVVLMEGSSAGRRGVPPAQAGPPVGAGPLRPRRGGLARPPGSAGGGVPAGAADGERPAAGVDPRRGPPVLRAPVPQHEGHRRAVRASTPRRSSTTRASSGTCWPRGTPAPAARR